MDFLTLSVLFLVVNGALVPPKYLWPLSGDSFTYDVTNNQMGVYPPFSDCFTVGPNHPNLSYTSMYFNGTDNAYVEVRIPADGSIADIGIVLFFKAEDPDGSIFQYEADDFSTIDNTIASMSAYLSDGNLIGTFLSPFFLAVNFPVNNGPYPVTLEKWTMIALTHNNVVKETNLYTDDVLLGGIIHGKQVTLRTPGTFVFGNRHSFLPSAPFKGFITAAALYNSPDVTNMGEVIDHASKINWPTTPPVPPCKQLVQSYTISHVWPLDNQRLTTDTKTSLHNDNQKCLRFEQIHPNLPNKALHVDGSFLSSVQLYINASEIDASFTLATNIYVRSPTSGSMITITKLDGETIFDMVLNGTKIRLEAFKNSSMCNSISVPTDIAVNTWFVVGIQKTIESNQISVTINDDIYSSTDTCGSFGLTGELMIKLGSSSSQHPGFRGDVRCLVMLDGPCSSITDVVTPTCSEAVNIPAGLANNCTTNSTRSRYHIVFKFDVTLSANFTPLVTGSSQYASGCAVLCYQYPFCRSFTYRVDQCVLYDFVTEIGLMNTPTAGYYMVDKRP